MKRSLVLDDSVSPYINPGIVNLLPSYPVGINILFLKWLLDFLLPMIFYAYSINYPICLILWLQQ